MAYPGGAPSGSYGYGYSPPGSYQPAGQQQAYPTNAYSQTSWDGSMQGMNPQQPQQMSHVQRMHGPQVQNIGAYYQNQQYAPVSNMAPPNTYRQVPVQHPQQYPQYMNQQQQNFPQYEHPVTSNSHSSYQQHNQIPSRSQQPPQPQRPLDKSSNGSTQVAHNREQPKAQSKNHPKDEVQSQPLDTPMLLIALAEEYFAAAHKIGPSVARAMAEDLMDEYQSLIATGLGCLEATLKRKNMRLAPRMEAKIRLRYAGVLFEETENYMEAETALSQGIILCEQNRFLDLKYSMQFLLAQLVYMKNSKASLKSLDRHCTDLEAYRHHSWEYVFRFLRASLSLQSGRVSDTQVALHDLRYISALASEREDRAVFLLSSLVEILSHLSTPNPDSVEQVQTALASAWSYQLDTKSQIPQLVILTHMLDVACSLLYGLPAQTELKQKAMEDSFKSFDWSTSTDSSDIITIPINPEKGPAQLVSQDSRGILGTAEDGNDMLMISFLNNNDTFALIYLLSGIALIHNNCADGKAAQYLKQGLLSVRDSNKLRKADSPLPGILSKLQWRDVISCYFLVYSVFCYASTSDWNAAKDRLEELNESLNKLEHGSKGLLGNFHVYLSGVCFQGTGELESALRMFRDPKLRLPEKPASSMSPEEKVQGELALLALLNTMWIQQADSRHDAAQNTAMIAKLEPLCANHANKNIETAFKLVKATVPTEPPTSGVKIKNYLGSALEAAKSTSNKQFLCITLGVMCNKFFVGVVGTQADKAGRAAVFQAKRTRNMLWMSVTNGMLAENLELQGQHEEAEAAKEEARRLGALAFPEPLHL